MINYEAVLKKYVNLVRASEGVDFIESYHRLNIEETEDDFTEEEWAELLKLHKPL